MVNGHHLEQVRVLLEGTQAVGFSLDTVEFSMDTKVACYGFSLKPA